MFVALMTRIPEPGKTKTRLQSKLKPEECALLHSAFIKDMIAMLKKTSINYGVFYTTDGNLDKLRILLPPNIPLVPQEGINLGARMFNSLFWGFNQGYKKVAVLGTDLPLLQPEILEQANKLLDKYDVVIGPSNDGGYYFLGMTQPIRSIFINSTWGNSSVFQETVSIIEGLKLNWAKLPEFYDIDYYEDLINLYNDLINNKYKLIPKNTFEFLKEFFLKKGDK